MYNLLISASHILSIIATCLLSLAIIYIALVVVIAAVWTLVEAAYEFIISHKNRK